MRLLSFSTRPDGRFDPARGCIVYPMSVCFTAYRDHRDRLDDFRLLPGIGDEWERDHVRQHVAAGKFAPVEIPSLEVAISCSLRAALESAAWAYANRQSSHGYPLRIIDAPEPIAALPC